MKIPKKLKVGAHTYTVEFTKHKNEERGRYNWGKTMHESKRILIDKEVPESQKDETFVHEILHLAMHESRLNYDFDDKVQLTDEQVVNRMTQPLHSILKNNNLLK